MLKNDLAWNRVIKEGDYLKKIYSPGYLYINADELKAIGQREPRLMAKHDTLHDRPKFFKDHNLSLFPVKNGQYILFRDDNNKSYFKFPEKALDLPVGIYHSKIDYHTYDSYPGSENLSESQAIDFAYLSSLLRTVTGEDNLNLVIRGRLFSGDFNFYLEDLDHHVAVSSVQIEVDAGYESRDSIYLIEAKIGKRDNFNVRQLFYPYLEWSHRSRKRIVPIFLVYTNSKYYFYEFNCSDKFGDLNISRSYCYSIDENPKPSINFATLINSVGLEDEPDIPYPQANDLDKVIDLAFFVSDGNKNKVDIAERFDFDERQGDYYANAARYLGFLDKDLTEFTLTELGKKFVTTRTVADRTLMIVRELLKKPTFQESIKRLVKFNLDVDLLEGNEIAYIIESSTCLSGSTPLRRASTVIRWLNWILCNGNIVIQE